MYGVWGVVLLALAVILFAFTFIESRKPKPGSWAVGDFSSQIIIMVTVGLLTFGSGLLVAFIFQLDEAPPSSSPNR